MLRGGDERFVRSCGRCYKSHESYQKFATIEGIWDFLEPISLGVFRSAASLGFVLIR